MSSASARSAEITGPAGWMMVFRCVSSKSKTCDEMPLTRATFSDVEPLAAAENGRAARAGEEAQRGEGAVDGRVERAADGATESS